MQSRLAVAQPMRFQQALVHAHQLGIVVVMRSQQFQQTDARFLHVVQADVGPVYESQRAQQPVLVARRGFHLAETDASPLTPQYFFKKISRATCRLQELHIHVSDRACWEHVGDKI